MPMVCLFLTLIAVATGWARTKYLVPPELASAKTVYIENQTRAKAIPGAAEEELRKWGRFTITPTQADADLSIVFRFKFGLDKWADYAFFVMDVYVKGRSEPAFETRRSLGVALAARNCVGDFRTWLEPKH